MIATIFRIFIIVLFPIVVFGQSLNVSVSAETNGNNTSTFLLDEGKVSINDGVLRFLNTDKEVRYDVFGISSDKNTIAVLRWSEEKGSIKLFDANGKELISFDTISLADQASFGLYPYNNGNTILRDKIANFTFYDSFGEIVTSMSSSSQSEEGEAISEVVTSRNGKTTVIYNPKIKRNGELGSKAQVRNGTNEFEDIFFSSNRYLKDVIISDDGSLIIAITAKSGSNDQVLVMDKYGNDLNTITVEEDLKGATVTDDLEHLTLYSGGRIMIYTTLSGESLGATSMRSPVKQARYFPEDNVVLAVTGSFSEQSGLLNGVEFRAVNLQKRSLASGKYSGALSFTDQMDARFVRNGTNSYTLEGTHRQIEIDITF